MHCQLPHAVPNALTPYSLLLLLLLAMLLLAMLLQASRLGLLSKLEKAGLTLRDVEKALPLLDEIDAIGLGQALGGDLLKVAPKALEAAPALLPLAGTH